ncbi:hypothetical protein BGX38DRAFT_1263761 [Terfezia claveryi]|nr:hypothetical protein BGX38DRAFT_1263761 [Terfezia claveryi]
MSSSSKSKAGETPGNPGTFLPLNYIPADSTPVNLTTSTSHTLDVPDTDTATIPPELNQLNPRKWKREDVKKFLEANKEEYDLEDEDIIRLYEGRVSGRVLLLLTEEKLITTYGLPPGTAGSIELLINALKQPQAVVKATQKWEDRPSHRRGFELSDTLTVPHPHQQLIKVPGKQVSLPLRYLQTNES